MNPAFERGLFSIFRWGLAFAGGWFVQQGIWTEGEATEYVVAGATAGAAALAALAWGVYDKYLSQKRQNTTVAVLNSLTGPRVPNVTSADIEKVIAQGDAAPATTPKDEVPVLTGTGDGMAGIRNLTSPGGA